MPDNILVNDAYWQPIEKPICNCDVCGGGIYQGNGYFDFDGDIVCEDCMRDYVRKHFRRAARAYIETEYGLEEE